VSPADLGPPSDPKPSRPARVGPVAGWVLAAIAVAAAVALLYGPALRLWWTYDDFYCLHLIRGAPLLASFSSAAWRQSGMFTPLLLVSFATDLRVFGLRPGLFYAHQLLSLALAALALFAVLRLWLPRRLALFASLLFLAGAPISAWAQELLVRHYVEGLILAAASVWLFVAGLRDRRALLAVISAACYFAASLEKEVYVPVIALLAALPERDRRSRFRALVPHAIALAAYLAWRLAEVGSLTAAQGWTIRAADLPSLLLRLPERIGASLAGSGWPAAALLSAGLAVGLGAAVVRRRGAALLLGWSLLLAAAPVFLVVQSFHPRYAGLPWLVLVVGFTFGLGNLVARNGSRRALSWLVAAAVVAGTLAANRAAWSSRYALAWRMSTEGRFFLGMAGGDLLRHPAIPAAAMNELRWLKESALRLPAGGGWFADDLFLCEPARPVTRVFEYRASSGRVEDVGSELPRIRSDYCARLRDAPLWGDFSHRGGDFFWSLGPYPDGTYSIVYGEGVERFDVVRSGGYRHHADLFTLRLRYQSPEGWITFSPDIPLDFRAASSIRWERPAHKS
jgi:hypothetical protein